MDKVCPLAHRSVISISGDDRFSFLQGLITKDIFKLEQSLFYALLLTPQGRIDYDLFIFQSDDKIFIDTDQPNELIKRIHLFQLRSKIQIQAENFHVYITFQPLKKKKDFIFKDPRHDELGYRFYALQDLKQNLNIEEYEEKRRQLHIPDGIKDMPKGRALPLEWNMDILNAVDFEKGCYIGQELTARTKYRDLIKKRIRFIYTEMLTDMPDDMIISRYHDGAFVFIRQ